MKPRPARMLYFCASELGADAPASIKPAPKNSKHALHFNALFGDSQYLQQHISHQINEKVSF
jgi:hypothetical protein